jgi:hypothetical protein
MFAWFTGPMVAFNCDWELYGYILAGSCAGANGINPAWLCVYKE